MNSRKPPPGWQGMTSNGLDDTVAAAEEVVFLSATNEVRDEFRRVQHEAREFRPSEEFVFLTGGRRRPRWVSTCFLNSSEVIERGEDTISRIRSSLISGRTSGTCFSAAFTAHDVTRGWGGWQDGDAASGGGRMGFVHFRCFLHIRIVSRNGSMYLCTFATPMPGTCRASSGDSGWKRASPSRALLGRMM